MRSYANALFTYLFCRRDAMLARVLAMALCLSVCLSQVGVLSKQMDEIICFFLVGGGFFRPVLHYLLRKFRYLQKQGYLELFSKLWTYKILPRHIDRRRTCYNLARERWTLIA